MAGQRCEISLQVLKNISRVHAIYYVAIATVIFSHVKITCYFHMWRYQVFARKLSWYFIGVYIIIIIIECLDQADIYILGADFCLSSDVSSHGCLNALAILPTQVGRIMGALPCWKQSFFRLLSTFLFGTTAQINCLTYYSGNQTQCQQSHHLWYLI